MENTHHQGEDRRLPINADELAASLASFAEDLGADLDRTLALVMTEFGRRVAVAENGSDGSDGVLLRDDVWPGLEPGQLFEGNDLAVTTDFRDVLGEVLARHLGLADLSSVFPNYTTGPARFPGLFV